MNGVEEVATHDGVIGDVGKETFQRAKARITLLNATKQVPGAADKMRLFLNHELTSNIGDTLIEPFICIQTSMQLQNCIEKFGSQTWLYSVEKQTKALIAHSVLLASVCKKIIPKLPLDHLPAVFFVVLPAVLCFMTQS